MNADMKKKLHARCDEILKGCLLKGGFLTQSETNVLALSTRTAHTTVLVRCGGSRFQCAVNELPMRIFEAEAAGDYVRDVCIPAGDFKHLQERFNGPADDCEACGGDVEWTEFDGRCPSCG